MKGMEKYDGHIRYNDQDILSSLILLSENPNKKKIVAAFEEINSSGNK
jgi:hypothetical protein